MLHSSTTLDQGAVEGRFFSATEHYWEPIDTLHLARLNFSTSLSNLTISLN